MCVLYGAPQSKCVYLCQYKSMEIACVCFPSFKLVCLRASRWKITWWRERRWWPAARLSQRLAGDDGRCVMMRMSSSQSEIVVCALKMSESERRDCSGTDFRLLLLLMLTEVRGGGQCRCRRYCCSLNLSGRGGDCANKCARSIRSKK